MMPERTITFLLYMLHIATLRFTHTVIDVTYQVMYRICNTKW